MSEMLSPAEKLQAQLQAQANTMVNDAVGQEIGSLVIAKLSTEANLTIARQQLAALASTLDDTRAELEALKAAQAEAGSAEAPPPAEQPAS